ncbi:MAG: alcohol dehydrogenase catalytic domain-containing protein [Spirochaetaceae bacterium]|nr:alcohol dehydrogenase catalytic domain-containing protein [Spirochaetaceae bacterium]
MKALVYTGVGQLEMQDCPDPTDEFVVKVAGCGICGTDLKTYQKGHHLFRPPTILGHEFCGTVWKAPADCGYAVGDPVLVAPYTECGKCERCTSGTPEMCQDKSYVETGAFCEYVGMPASYLQKGVFRIPEADDAYTLVEPLACVLNGMDHLRSKSPRRALVVGSGPMGALFALLFSTRGIPVTVIEPARLRREAVAGWGIDARESGPVEDGAYDAVIIAVNKRELVTDYLKAVADGGTLLMFSGLGRDEMVCMDAYSIHYREVTISGSFGYAMPHFRQALDLVGEHREQLSRVITHEFPLEDGKKAFELLAAGQAFKIVLHP